MSSLTRKWLFLLAVIALVLGIDQGTKWLVITHLAINQSFRPIPALYPFFEITRIGNSGSAFGFLPQAGDVFLIIALLVVAAILVYYPRVPEDARLTRFAMGLVVGGALGNAVDRLTHGAVIDFIHYQIPGLISNVSNLADHAIVVGVLIVVALSWRSDPGSPEDVPKEEASDENRT